MMSGLPRGVSPQNATPFSNPSAETPGESIQSCLVGSQLGRFLLTQPHQ